MNILKFILLVSALLIHQLVYSQVEITDIRSSADSLREEGNLLEAIKEFQKIYFNDSSNKLNIYNYACALAVMEMRDSCFKYLNKSLELDTSIYGLSDPDFIPIKDDKRWEEFENRSIRLIVLKTKSPYKDIDYAKKLWRMKAKDQAYYNEIELAENKIGKSSTVVKALWNLKEIYNNQNQIELEKLIEEKGWPKISVVGRQAASAAFLIIQHSDLEKQKKYLPIIERLCKEKEASWGSYALMYDRIQTNENKPQKYGSQVMWDSELKTYQLFPLLDETKVDEWRKEIGMEPLSEYLSNWDIKFEPKKK